MKTLKTTLILTAFLLSTCIIDAKNIQTNLLFGETPAKTVVIKNPAADDTKIFFSNSTVYAFEVFKVGDAKALVEIMKKNKDVEACISNNPIGDFTPIQLSLKTNKNKAWFINLFKSSGLNFIRINHNEVVGIDKM